MTSNETAPNGSIVRLDASRPDLLAFEVRDRITKPDMEWMAGIADRAMSEYDKFDMLIVMANYEGADWGAKFDSYSAKIQTKSLAHIRRYAVVGAPVFAEAMIAISGALSPVETKTFDLEEQPQAWRWLEERDV